MPTLPEPLRKPHPWLALVGLAILWGFWDLQRAPSRQTLPVVYQSGITLYQWVKPRCGFEGCCRFSPSCSRYSSQAVQRHGLVRGLELTASRLQRCRTDIELGTSDPVPKLLSKHSPERKKSFLVRE